MPRIWPAASTWQEALFVRGGSTTSVVGVAGRDDGGIIAMVGTGWAKNWSARP